MPPGGPCFTGKVVLMTTIVRTAPPANDPLGYEGDVLARVRAMAHDALAGANEDAVEEEAAVLRNRLGLTQGLSGHGADQIR